MNKIYVQASCPKGIENVENELQFNLKYCQLINRQHFKHLFEKT